MRAEAKSSFHEVGCGTSEIHYGLREVQHWEDHSKLKWGRSEDSEGGCANGKGKRMVFSSKVQREMSISVIPTQTITSETEGQRVFSRESMRTPMKLGLRVFSAHDQRSIFFCPKCHLAGKRWGRGPQTWHTLLFHRIRGTWTECLNFLLFFNGDFSVNEHNKAAHGVKSHLSTQRQVFPDPTRYPQQPHGCNCRANCSAKASLEIEYCIHSTQKDKTWPHCNIVILRSPLILVLWIMPNLPLECYSFLSKWQLEDMSLPLCIHMSTRLSFKIPYTQGEAQ